MEKTSYQEQFLSYLLDNSEFSYGFFRAFVALCESQIIALTIPMWYNDEVKRLEVLEWQAKREFCLDIIKSMQEYEKEK